MLATESESSERAASALSGWAITSPGNYYIWLRTIVSSKIILINAQRSVAFQKSLQHFAFPIKKEQFGKADAFPCLSLWISEGDSLGTREPHVVCSCVFPRGRMHRACWEKACFLSKLWSGDRIAWSSVATTRDSQRRQATVLWLYPILLN